MQKVFRSFFDVLRFAFWMTAGVTDVHEPADQFDFLADFFFVWIIFAKPFEHILKELFAECMLDAKEFNRVNRLDDVEGHIGLKQAGEFVERFSFGKSVHVNEKESIRRREKIFEMAVPM